MVDLGVVGTADVVVVVVVVAAAAVVVVARLMLFQDGQGPH